LDSELQRQCEENFELCKIYEAQFPEFSSETMVEDVGDYDCGQSQNEMDQD
jgi:hypothetical protein